MYLAGGIICELVYSTSSWCQVEDQQIIMPPPLTPWQIPDEITLYKLVCTKLSFFFFTKCFIFEKWYDFQENIYWKLFYNIAFWNLEKTQNIKQSIGMTFAPIIFLQDDREEEPTFPDFETFVSTHTVFYFGPDLKFGMF